MGGAHWQKDPEPHDFAAAADYLSLIFDPATVEGLVEKLKLTETIQRKAKDLLRASSLPLLPADDPTVVRDLKKVADGKKLSPVLLLRGRGGQDIPLIVADGYHRICASYHLDESQDVACRIIP